MASRDLIARWKQIADDLSYARNTLLPQSASHPAIFEFQRYLNHNELELACDMLEAFAETHPVSPAFWQALGEAAQKMKLLDRAADYRRRANQA